LLTDAFNNHAKRAEHSKGHRVLRDANINVIKIFDVTF